jgi:citrate lyase beta subunit
VRSQLVTVRMNRSTQADVEAVVRTGAGGVRLPKVESADPQLAGLEDAAGRAIGSGRLFPLIESAGAVLRAEA